MRATLKRLVIFALSGIALAIAMAGPARAFQAKLFLPRAVNDYGSRSHAFQDVSDKPAGRDVVALLPRAGRFVRRTGARPKHRSAAEPRIPGGRDDVVGMMYAMPDHASLMVALSILAGLLLTWAYTLRRAVANRTQQLEQKNAQLLTLINHSPDLIWLTDPEGVYQACNALAAKLLGSDIEHVVGRTDADFLAPRLAAEHQRRDREAIRAGHALIFDETVDLPGGEGQRILEKIKVPVFDSDRKAIAILGVARDITQRKEAEAKLIQASKVFETMRDGVLVTDAEGRIMMINPAFTRITLYEADDVLGKTPSMLAANHGNDQDFSNLWVKAGSPKNWGGEVQSRRKNGKVFLTWWTVTTATDAAGNVTHNVGVFADISKMREYQDHIRFLRYHDPITHLPNRNLFMEWLQRAMERADREPKELAVLKLSLDNLKMIQETLGPQVADEFVVRVAELLKHRVGSPHALARIGEDRFAVLIRTGNGMDELTRIADDILQSLSIPQVIGDQKMVARVSVGVARYPDDAMDATGLMRCVDSALAQASRNPNSRLAFYNEELGRMSRQAFELEVSMRNALDEGLFELYYHPQYTIDTEQLWGVEALIRWRDSDGRLVMPGQFIPHAEECGLIVPIGKWVLERACTQVAEWDALGYRPIKLAVNISAYQLDAPGFMSDLKAILGASGLAPERLELEITEGQLLDKTPTVDHVLDELLELGVTVAIDDFGTGYSSLSALRHLRADWLKIDKSFVDDIVADTAAERIVSAIISMAHTLRMKVVAEGVETRAQADLLRRLGCDRRQGYLDCQPLSAGDLVEKLDPASASCSDVSGSGGRTRER